MSKALRWSEKWFRFGLWLVAVVFASFLIGLGGTVVENLPKVESCVTLEDFMDRAAAEQARNEIRQTEATRESAQAALEQAQLKHNTARANSLSARDTFNNWLATRSVTQRAAQDSELIARTQALDALKATERQALAAMEKEQQVLLDAQQAAARAASPA